MKKNFALSCSFVIIIGILFIINSIFSGCSGASGLVSVSAIKTPGNTPFQEAGTFTLKIEIPGKVRVFNKSNDKVIPYLYGSSNTLRVSIEGEDITTPIYDEVNITGPGSYNLSISSIPVGNKIATITIFADAFLLAQRNYPFYMTAGSTVSLPNPFTMGVTINEFGECLPQDIDIQKGETIYFQNLDPNNDRVVKLDKDETIITLPSIPKAVKPPDISTIAGELYGTSYTFNDEGDYKYVDGYGTNSSYGRILVYIPPSAIRCFSDNTTIPDKFKICGTYFGEQLKTNGELNFYDTNGSSLIATVNSFNWWNENEIEGDVSDLVPGNYLVRVKVRTNETTEDIYFEKYSNQTKNLQVDAVPYDGVHIAYSSLINKLYITEPSNNRVHVLNSDVTEDTSFGSPGTGLGQFQQISGIVINNSGLIYITEQGPIPRVQIFNISNTPTTTIDAIGINPSSIAVTSEGHIYVIDDISKTVIKYVSSWNTWSGPPFGFFVSTPTGIAVDPGGNVYITGKLATGDKIVKYDPSGTKLGEWVPTFGMFQGDVNGITYNNSYIYVTDGDMIRKFDTEGNEISIWNPGPPNINLKNITVQKETHLLIYTTNSSDPTQVFYSLLPAINAF